MRSDDSAPGSGSPIRFEVETEFFDQLARIIPSAPIRQVFLERGIIRQLRLELGAWKRGGRVGVLLDDGFGLLMTEENLLGIPELLVVFEYEPLQDPTQVTLSRVVRMPDPDDAEDDTGQT